MLKMLHYKKDYSNYLCPGGKMLEKALIPLNLHESSQRVCDMCDFLKNFGTRQILLLHVGSTRGKAAATNQKKLEKYAGYIRKMEFNVTTFLCSGSTQVETIKVAEEKEVDYISLPFKKKNWLHYAIMGSQIKNIVRQSNTPVFIYKSPHLREKTDNTFRVLFAVALKEDEENLALYIRDNNFQADEVIFLHAGKRAPDPVVEKQRQHTIETNLVELREQCGLTAQNAPCLSLLGIPRNQIVRTAKKYAVNLVLLGKKDTEEMREPMLGSTVENVSYLSPCSVLIVPRKEVAL